MWKIFSVPCGSALYKFHCTASLFFNQDRLCGVVVKVPGYRSRSIPGAPRASEKEWVWNMVHSTSRVQLRSYLEEKVAAPA
jgi:hypothetical protein